MASIVPYRGDRWRVFIEKRGIRKGKTFKTREDAEAWVAEIESLDAKDLRGYFAAKTYDLAHTALTTKIPPRVLEANHAIPFKHDEILGAGILSSMASGIYFLIRGQEVVYVGQSLDMLHRIARHRREGRAFDRYACLECKPEKLDELESHYIAAFAPRDNLTFGNGKRRRTFATE